jgi:hypothetical protein
LRFLYAVRFTGFTTTVWSRTALMPLLSLDPRQSFAVVGGVRENFAQRAKFTTQLEDLYDKGRLPKAK